MATSGTAAFNPPLGDLVQYAYGLIGVRRTAIVQEHMIDARMAANMLQADWANKGPNLWTVDLQTVVLVPGQATYAVPQSTVTILDAYIRTIPAGGDPIDRPINSISRTDYAALPNKLSEGYPTVFWFNRQISPELTLWQVPDDTQGYELRYYRFAQIEDAAYASGLNVELPYRWLAAFAFGLAELLAMTYAPAALAVVTPKAKEFYASAAEQDTEDAPVYITPALGGYFRP